MMFKARHDAINKMNQERRQHLQITIPITPELMKRHNTPVVGIN